jgi:hypothetical protein
MGISDIARKVPSEQDQQRLAAGAQVRQARVDADGGEEIHQQHVTRRQVKLHREPGRPEKEPEQHRQQQPARHRLRNAELPKKADSVIQPLADEQHDDAEREGQKRPDLRGAVLEFDHSAMPWVQAGRAVDWTSRGATMRMTGSPRACGRREGYRRNRGRCGRTPRIPAGQRAGVRAGSGTLS